MVVRICILLTRDFMNFFFEFLGQRVGVCLRKVDLIRVTFCVLFCEFEATEKPINRGMQKLQLYCVTVCTN
jgi:hypothetical protein